MPLLVILGINGRQGTSVANAFLSIPGWTIRGLTSLPSCERSRQWLARGVEIVQVDLMSELSIRTAFANATAIFAVTDYYATFHNPSTRIVASVHGTTVADFAFHIEKRIGYSILEAAADVDSLERFVWSTLPYMPERQAPNKRGHRMVMSRWETAAYARYFPELAAKTSFLKPGLRMEDYGVVLKEVS